MVRDDARQTSHRTEYVDGLDDFQLITIDAAAADEYDELAAIQIGAASVARSSALCHRIAGVCISGREPHGRD